MDKNSNSSYCQQPGCRYYLNEDFFYMLKLNNIFKPVLCALTAVVGLCLSSLVFAASPVLDRVVESGVLKVDMSVDLSLIHI